MMVSSTAANHQKIMPSSLARKKSFFFESFRGRRRPSLRADTRASTSSKRAPSPKKVVVLGGGFGGLYCALKLDALSWREKNGEQPKPIVTLIDANETFLFKPLMYELLTLDMEETEVAPSYEELLQNTTVRFVRKEATKIVPDTILTTKSGTKVSGTGGEVIVRDALTNEEERVKYDYLVVSLGAKVDFESEKNFVKGAKEFAIPFNGLEDVKEMQKRIERLKEVKEDEKTGGGWRRVRGSRVGVVFSAMVRKRGRIERCEDQVSRERWRITQKRNDWWEDRGEEGVGESLEPGNSGWNSWRH